MRLFKVNNIYLNLDNIKKLHVVENSYRHSFNTFTGYADDIIITKDFKLEAGAHTQLEIIVSYIEGNHSGFKK